MKINMCTRNPTRSIYVKFQSSFDPSVLELKYGSQHLVDQQPKTTEIIVSSSVTNDYQKPNIENQ